MDIYMTFLIQKNFVAAEGGLYVTTPNGMKILNLMKQVQNALNNSEISPK
jgi:hypothetical protein